MTAGLLRHGGDKVLEWMAENCMAVIDAAGNIKPDKAEAASASTESQQRSTRLNA